MSENEASVFLDYYLDEHIEAEFAVMLDGPWGAGKTHFIKKYLGQWASRLTTQEKPSYLYASLYGVTSTSEITDQFFSQAHPILNSKASRLLGAVASKALNGFAGTDVNSAAENRTVLQQMIMRLDGKILVFDDLERCSMSIADVMGFINTYVEHEGLKVIILANEADIPEDQRETYKRQKEKLIGKTIQVKSDPVEVIDKLMDRLRLNAVREVVARERSVLINTFLASGKTNYRSLRAILHEYERLVGAIDPRVQSSSEGMTQLLLYMIATGQEYRSGDLDLQVMKELPTSQFYVMIGANGKEKSPAVLEFERLKNRYVDVKWFDPIVAPVYLADLYRTGLIDVEAINKVLSQHPVIAGYAATPPWRLLWSWADLSKPQYVEAKRQLLAQLARFEINHPGIILHVAGIVIMLNEFGDPFLGEGVDVIEYFDDYLKNLVDNGLLLPDRKTFGFMSVSYAGLGYPAQESDAFGKIRSLVKGATDLACAQQMKDIAAQYTQRLLSDPNAYGSLYEYGFEDGNYADVAFLHNLNVAEFAQLLIVESSPNDRLFASLAQRYESERHHSWRLKEEYEWLARLRCELVSLATSEDSPYKQLLNKKIEYYFGLIFKAISSGI